MANPDTALAKPEKCSAPELYDAVTDTCFGHADEHKRRLVEEHLTVCAVCRREVATLTSAVEVLRFDRELMPPVSGNEVASTFGWSSRLHRPLGGHRLLVLVSCVLYSLLYVAMLWVEVGLQVGRYASQVAKGSPFVFALIFATTLVSLKLCWRRTARGADYTLTLSILVLLAATFAAYGLSWLAMPTSPVNGASTPQQIYFMGAAQFLSLIVMCLLIPFHFIVSMQRELSEGKHGPAMKLLRREKDGISPRGTIYLKFWFPLSLLSAHAIYSCYGQFQFFNTIGPGGYRDFYVTAWAFTWFIFYALGAGWMVWYYRMINELKRECLIARFFD